MMTGTADRSGGPTLRYRVRCQSCEFSERFRSRADAIRVQKHGCPRCGHGVGVSRVRADPDDQQLITDGGTDCQHADPDTVFDREESAECACPFEDCEGRFFLEHSPEGEFWYYCDECETNLCAGDQIRFEMPTSSFAGRIVAISGRGTIRVRSVTTVDIDPDQVTAKLEGDA